MSRHAWLRLPDTKEPGMPTFKHWECTQCACKKEQGNYKFSIPSFVRSGQIYTETPPPCVNMDRRSDEPLD